MHPNTQEIEKKKTIPGGSIFGPGAVDGSGIALLRGGSRIFGQWVQIAKGGLVINIPKFS